MQRRLFIISVVLSLAALVPWAVADTATHCLWRISKDANHIYLQGSVHLLKKSHYPLPDAIENAYADSAVLVLEADLSAAQDPAQQMALLKAGMLEGKATLQGSLSKETWAMAEKQIAEMGMNIALFNAFKPWYFATSITALRLQSLGFSAFDGIDWHFFNRAKTDGKPVVGLETLEYQMSLFDAISAEDQDALVRQTMEDIANIDEEMDAILDAWAVGDLKAMDESLLKNFKEYPVVYKSLVTDRNHNWIAQIVGFLESGKVHMIVVGAGHLSGKEGLLQLLKKQGLQLKQL
ncbi:MAG: TraB/GumN family protein [Kiritimatiellae bacterium]|nr:TraB/GumN family protein [Kiritimatiellia bacterium]